MVVEITRTKGGVEIIYRYREGGPGIGFELTLEEAKGLHEGLGYWLLEHTPSL